ncbi:hypothetical protein GCM10009836_05240 [Pseudonocardia ailaonensis]|uniref:Secreted protein n=1 Tax=Pseudonocardia ailaonensis TaxID=367279 RepID=A0ABN2MLQ4_9PSEU
MRPSRSTRLAAAGLLAAGLLAGCGAPTTHAAASGGNGAPSATLPALQTKLASIVQDECATQQPAQIFPNCARFVREVQNIVPAARAEAGSVRSGAAVTQAAADTDDAVNRFTQDVCTPVAGAKAGPAAVCGPDLAAMQQGLKALVSALGSS